MIDDFEFDLGGVSGPEMDIQGDGTSIADGDTSPSTADHTDFGSALVSGGTVVRTFTIENTGSAALDLTAGSPFVFLTGSTDFSLTATPSGTIGAGSSTTFNITFDPSAVGTATATVSIANNDADEDPYNFDIQGSGVEPEVFFDVAADNVGENGGTYTITATSTATGAHTAQISLGVGGSATDGTEFTFGGPVTASFASGTTFTTTVTINNNSSCDGDVNALFDLGSPSGCTIGTPGQLDLTIVEDDLVSGPIAEQDFDAATTWTYSVDVPFFDNGTDGFWGIAMGSPVPVSAGMSGNFLGVRDLNDEGLGTSGEAIVTFADVDVSAVSNGTVSFNYDINGFNASSDYIRYEIFHGPGQTLGQGQVDVCVGCNSASGTVSVSFPDVLNTVSLQLIIQVDGGSDYAGFDAFTVVGDQCSTPCSTPTDQATALTFIGSTTSQIDGSFTTATSSPDGYLVVAYPSSGSASTPVDGTVYAPGDPLGGGVVVAFGTGTSFSHTGLTAGTAYTVEVYAYNNLSCTGGPAYNTTSPLSGSEFTVPEVVTDLTVGCTDGGSMELSWTAPVGNFDGVVVAFREDPSLGVHTINGSSASYTPNTVFGSGFQFGSTTPFSYTVFNGTGTSVMVTGLTPGATYQIKAVAYVDGDLWSADATTSGDAQVPDAFGGVASTGNTELDLSWTNPASACIDEVLVIAREASAVTATPIGDGSAYTANAAFGSGTAVLAGQFVVYQGTGSSETVTGLTNGTEYYFTVFARKGTDWSEGHSFSGTPNTATVLDRGDFILLAVNTQALSSGSDDQLCFTAFKEITPFTAIDLTDNGYERVNAGQWGDTEGTIRLERNAGASTIPAGTVICIQGAGNDATDFEIRVEGINDDANWSISSLNGSSYFFDLNGTDQVWFLQNGGWVNPGASHDATYTGNVLYGWTAIGWEAAPGYGGTAGSTVPDGLNCFTTDVNGATNPDKVKYNGPVSPATQREWIARVNDAVNWTDYSSNSAYNAGGYDYWGAALGTITINPGGFSTGVWEGNANSNWFDCDNWQNLDVPDASVSVTVSATSSNDIVVDAAAAFADQYGFVAQADTIVLDRGELRLEGSGSELQAYGLFRIAGTGELLFDASNATELTLYGDWDNDRDETAVTEGVGTVRFAGGAAQDLSVQNGTEEVFHNIVLDKDYQTVLTLSADLATTATGSVTLTGGIVETGAQALSVCNPGTGAIGGVDLYNPLAPGIYDNDGYINGRVERSISGAGSYRFPVGDVTSGNAYNYLMLDISSGSGTLVASYDPGSPGTINVNTTTSCPPVFDVAYSAMNNGFWTVDQTGGGTISYDITVYPNDAMTITAPTTDDNYRVLKAPAGTSDWSPYALDGDPCVISPSFNEIIGAGYTGFSDFAIGGGGTPLPVTLVDLEAHNEGDAVAVEWTTATEQNSAHFVVQRSSNGLDWTAIGQVAAAGTSTSRLDYRFIDELPLGGWSYYRLKQVDLDESFTLTDAVVVQRVFASGEIRIWPNPTTGTVSIAGAEDIRSLEVVDLTGRVLVQTQKAQVDLGSLPAGLYHLRIQDANGTQVLRVQKH